MKSAGTFSLERKRAFLENPASYPGHVTMVDTIETHMSWVFLTQCNVYKLKKPIRLDHIDFRSLAARKRYCEEEVRLNSRLASGVYEGLTAIVLDVHGALALDDAPQRETVVVDWLVKMRRLPADGMLDRLVMSRAATAEHIDRVAGRLVSFYKACAPIALAPSAYMAAFSGGIDINQRILCRARYHLPIDRVRRLCAAQRTLLMRESPLLAHRASGGRIVEGHGDLRPEHICLVPVVAIIDCLEFDPALRIVDPLDELGYLALELDRLGADRLAKRLLSDYRNATGDHAEDALVHFYQSYRAAVRARIAIRHLDEARYRTSPKWRLRALDYLSIAERHHDAVSSVSEPSE